MYSYNSRLCVYKEAEILQLHLLSAHRFVMHTADVGMAQVTGLLNKTVPHQKLSVQNSPAHSAGLPGVERGREQGPAAWPISPLLLLAQKYCSQMSSLFCLVSCHPFPCSMQ